MHILLGALVGGTLSLMTVAVVALVTGSRPGWKAVALAVLGGAVAGAVTSATLGASSIVGVGTARQVVAFAAGGAAGGAAEQVTDNAIEGRPLQQGVVRATAAGAGTGLASLGAMRVTRYALGRLSPIVSERAARLVSRFRGAPRSEPTLVGRILSAPAPGTGGSFVRALDEPEPKPVEPAPDDGQGLPLPPRTGFAQHDASAAADCAPALACEPDDEPAAQRPAAPPRQGMVGSLEF